MIGLESRSNWFWFSKREGMGTFILENISWLCLGRENICSYRTEKLF